MEIVFENGFGSIKMNGGGGSAPFRLRAVEGLGYMAQTATAVNYPFRSGQRTISRTPAARIITVSFDAAESGRRYDDMLGKIGHDSGRLYVTDGAKSVYAECYVSNLSAAQIYGSDYGRYTAQFTCDYPYFRDSEPTLRTLFERTALISGKLELPSVFSTRTAGSKVNVTGDKAVYPTVTVGNVSGEENFELVILNETSGNELKLNLPAGKYSLIEFDLFNGSISCGGRDFTVYLDDDCYMSDFLLREGENSLKITAAGLEAGTAASVCFENEYITAREDK